MCVNNLSKVVLDSAAAGIEPATSSRKSNALTTAPPRIVEIQIENGNVVQYLLRKNNNIYQKNIHDKNVPYTSQ